MKFKISLSVIILAILTLVGFESCKNDIEVFAPESDITLIYGLLSGSDNIHQVKINRVFQGTDAVDQLAEDPTNSEYENIEARLLELRDDGFGTIDTLNAWPFVEKIITDKDSGYF
ncbi:MAG: hypothetical protein ACJA2N_002102, partial [Salibacteraceae bacterium]